MKSGGNVSGPCVTCGARSHYRLFVYAGSVRTMTFCREHLPKRVWAA